MCRVRRDWFTGGGRGALLLKFFLFIIFIKIYKILLTPPPSPLKKFWLCQWTEWLSPKTPLFLLFLSPFLSFFFYSPNPNLSFFLQLNKVLKAMRESDSIKPAIFAMSNPTMNGLLLWLSSCIYIFLMATEFNLYVLFAYSLTAECTAADAFRHAGENIVFASGSPFENVDLGISPSSWCLSCLQGFSHHTVEAMCSNYLYWSHCKLKYGI